MFFDAVRTHLYYIYIHRTTANPKKRQLRKKRRMQSVFYRLHITFPLPTNQPTTNQPPPSTHPDPFFSFLPACVCHYYIFLSGKPLNNRSAHGCCLLCYPISPFFLKKREDKRLGWRRRTYVGEKTATSIHTDDDDDDASWAQTLIDCL